MDLKYYELNIRKFLIKRKSWDDHAKELLIWLNKLNKN